MQVKVVDLKALADKILTHLETTGHSVVNIDADFYWDVPPKERYDQYEKPATFTVGQLSDDWSELERLLDDRRLPLNYALVWLATILRRIGETAGEAG